ncbi:trigger factor [Carboxylicivirga marina]|uniref:trigger factor n=1 Tax=Carboxylicivirga marina TaxID=2800988 RepID=UPI00259366A8|nr:trigger factor [uncultured Carboxylicivirga sp.]
MNISKENIDALNAVIKLTVEKEDYAGRVDNVLKDYRKRVNMPGFRAGKVPMGVVKKMYGKAVIADEVNKLVSEKIHSYIVDEKLDLLGEPLPSETQELIDFDNSDKFDFVFDVAIAPEMELSLSKRIKLPYYKVEVSEEMFKQQKDSVTGRFGKSEPVEAATEKALVKGNFAQLEGGDVKEGGIAPEDVVLSMAIIKDEDEKAKLMGAKANDVIVFDPKKAFPNDTEISHMLKITKEEAEALTGDFQFTVTEVTEFVEAELNQDLFNQAFGEGVVNSEEEFNARINEDIAKNLEMETEYRFSIDAKEKLMGKVKVDFPEAFLKRWLLATNRDNEKLDADTIDTEMPRFLEDLKWQLIRNNIIKNNDVKVEEADVIEFAKKSAKMQFMQYGLASVPDEHLENYAQEMLKQDEQRRQMAEGAMQEKVIAFIKEAVKVEEKEITRDDFNKLFDTK